MGHPNSLPRVAVLVDLERHAHAGGHVRFWEHIARAAAERTLGIRLELHFRGESDRAERWSDQVTLKAHTPVMSSASFKWLQGMPDSGDLAPWHPRLVQALRGVDLIHCTDGLFAFAGAARRVARREHTPLVTSLHTDAVSYGWVYTQYALTQARGLGAWCGKALSLAGLPRMVAALMQRRQARHLQASDWVMTSADKHAEGSHGWRHQSALRRGIDRTVFKPDTTAGRLLRAELGIPSEAKLVAFTGRLSPGKQVSRIAAVVNGLRARGIDARAVFAGSGPERPALAKLLGANGYFLGQIAPLRVAAMLNAADLFLFPSQIEVWPNAVNEARACALPVLVDANGGGRLILSSGDDGIVVAGDDVAWSDATATLLGCAEERARMARRALGVANVQVPDWGDVLDNDLLPVWQQLLSRERAAGWLADSAMTPPKLVQP